jgi:GR25 family glycosyltransferase involved in LPS biosynthesis
MNYIISLLLIIIIIIFTFFKPKIYKELFENNNIFYFYVITLGKKERLENIEKQQSKINNKINIFNAVQGKKLDYDKLKSSNKIIDNEILSKKYEEKMSQIGCYLSHLNIYKKIKNDYKKGYTIIFEDDFLITTPYLINEINKSINILKKNIDFDFIFLGNLRNNHGKNIQDNLYYLDKNINLFGTHGYIVNNKNIDKIINNLNKINTTIDDSIQDLSYKNIFNTFVIYPNLVEQEELFKSTIRV